MKRIALAAALFCVSSLVTHGASPAVEATIAKARAYLGGEEALNAINSVRFEGTIEMVEEPATSAPEGKSQVEITFQKPTHHRLVVSSEKSIDITGLDDYVAWRQSRPAGGAIRMMTMNKDQVQRLRANTWENLYFFTSVEEHGGKLIDHGETVTDGVPCHKITFQYGPGIEFTRYFNRDTGALVVTETGPIGQIREEGEIVVQGVRFPQKLVASGTTPDGKKRTVTITFERITLNEAFPRATFEQPLLLPAAR